MSTVPSLGAAQRPIYIRSDITSDRSLRNGRLYVISGQVHVKSGITLTVEDGVRVGIRNGRVRNCRLARAALIFESGAALQALRLTLFACGRGGNAEKQADNGGIWFCGAHHSAHKDGIHVRKARGTPASAFRAKSLSARYLGRADAPEGTPQAQYDDAHNLDDLDAVSVMGVGLAEWQIEALHILGAGDDALDLQNSVICLGRLAIHNPTEDALNISSSGLHITEQLRVRMTRRGEVTDEDADRDIFDFGVDDSPSHVSLHRGTLVKLAGVFGDEITLHSKNMPAFQEAGREMYLFSDRCERALTLIQSVDKD
jgi:hypothetical protein